ncbi:hypothetical protein [Alterisphingorhabdus coralli]|uniref:Uncharacterized protein n=1 Tax=Alterisphingorhabdus coralli TaxID=3071408 RepID=A0AA97F7S1_9SPHN|nr:hypothetical protein [Parasphingorhabdus sp. SCSIO 66989]WOE75036.1 hypothetical protein RB602_14565 [Parasphingorhabdus sp. SCSIO 66989]
MISITRNKCRAVQLKRWRDAVLQANAYNDQQFSQLSNRLNARIDDIRFDLTEYRQGAQAGIASVSALTQLRYHDDPGALSKGGAIGGFMG